MKRTNRFMLKLSFLIVPFAIFTFVLHDGGGSYTGGGGGYDLSGLVYGLLLFACIITWLIWISIAYFITKKGIERQGQIVLIATGLVALIAAWFITPNMF